MTTVTFEDETAGGEPRTALQLTGLPDRMTARALLHLRVREEATCHNAARPTNAEPVDWRTQAGLAERAFLSNAFFILTATDQIDDLDEVIDLTTTPTLTFLRLIPLAGG